MHSTFDTAFYKILNAIGDISERTYCDNTFYMWPTYSCDLISDSIGIEDTMIFKIYVGSDKYVLFCAELNKRGRSLLFQK